MASITRADGAFGQCVLRLVLHQFEEDDGSGDMLVETRSILKVRPQPEDDSQLVPLSKREPGRHATV